MQPGKSPPPIDLLNMITGHWKAQAIYVAAKLGIADVLRDGPMSSSAIASAVGAHPGSLYRLLRALGSLGVFRERSDGQFELTPISVLLQTEHPGSMRSITLAMCGPPYRAWEGAFYSVTTGKSAFEHIYGESFFEHLAKDAEASRVFNEAMSNQSRMAHSAVAASYDFSPFTRIVDVGGGNGTLLELILRSHPSATGVLFDQPHVVENARERLARSDIAGRCEVVGGSFFESVPMGGDAYIMAMVIHDWDDEAASTILKNCRRAMDSEATLLLSELVIPPGGAPFFGKLLDLDMLINLGGKERTEDEYRSLLSACGFELLAIVPAHGPSSALSIIECMPC
jgi:hypothetical protein